MAANFNNSTPVAIAGYTNGTWQFDGSGNISVCFLTPLFNEENTSIISLIPGDILVWNGSQWINATPPIGNIDVNGVLVENGNFVNSASVTFSVVGSNISATAATGTFPVTIAAATSEWLNSYTSTTGLFTATQPTFTDLSAHPTTLSGYGITDALPSSTVLPVTIAATAHKWINSYTSSTGAFTETQPAVADLSDTPAAGQVLAGPATGVATTATFRALVATDIPALAYLTNPMVALGDMIYENATPAPAKLSGNITTTKEYLSQTGNGTISAAPVWAQINYADIAGTTPTPPSGTVLWSALGNAGANLTLANAAYTTEFDQTSNVAWLWANTTVATVSTTNASPLHEFAANYYTGSASAQDLWTIGSSLVAGTNGATYLEISHSGSTGPAQIDVAGFASGYKATIIDSTVSSTAGIALGGGTSYPFSVVADAGGGEPFNMVGLWYGTNIAGALCIGTYSKTISLGTDPNNNWGGLILGALALYAATTCPVVSISCGTSLTAGLAGTSGTQVGLSVGTVDGAVPFQNAHSAGGSMVFSPASGNAKFYALNVNPIINQTGTASGSYTALLINATETAVLGTANMLIDCQVSNVRVWGITNKGHEIVGSANNDGSGVISSVSGTTVSKTYAVAYTSTPIVTVTPTTNAGAYYLSASSNTGFTVTYASSGAQTFNYQVIGNPN